MDDHAFRRNKSPRICRTLTRKNFNYVRVIFGLARFYIHPICLKCFYHIFN